ncbi:Hypothetical predicted protein [Paramuricea clavata]|uniref:Uncharacterized protein n=1 Tax=Paramuricea clavata TaxID=317549 RepID=A0A6S7HCE0_PARCT|nr:Hypothetical predicted protein [Paramuricea clavata]
MFLANRCCHVIVDRLKFAFDANVKFGRDEELADEEDDDLEEDDDFEEEVTLKEMTRIRIGRVVVKRADPQLRDGLIPLAVLLAIGLVQDLILHATPSSGTCRTNRAGFPKSLRNVKVWAKKLERGSMRWERESNVLAIQWVDNKAVSLLTSIDSANEKAFATRRTKQHRASDPDNPALHRGLLILLLILGRK